VIQEERASRKDMPSGMTWPANNRSDNYKPKPMEMPKINWAEEKRILDARQKRS
jgi:hypothetical protein